MWVAMEVNYSSIAICHIRLKDWIISDILCTLTQQYPCIHTDTDLVNSYRNIADLKRL